VPNCFVASKKRTASVRIAELPPSQQLSNITSELFNSSHSVSGIAEERISCDSKGELEPIVDNNSKENMAKNRRLEFVISE
jgi:hypothetical protein